MLLLLQCNFQKLQNLSTTKTFHKSLPCLLYLRVTHTDFIWNYKTGRSPLTNNKNIYTSRRLATSTINQTVISRRAEPGLLDASIPQNKIPYMCHIYDGLGRRQAPMATELTGPRGWCMCVCVCVYVENAGWKTGTAANVRLHVSGSSVLEDFPQTNHEEIS